jgi:hypothetical protein
MPTQEAAVLGRAGEEDVEMSGPVRIQLSRRKGWRMPPNTVKVDRGTLYGNPFPLSYFDGDKDACVAHFRELAEAQPMRGLIRNLEGKNLACWCALCAAHKEGKPFDVECGDCSPCHSDVLGDLAARKDSA